MILTSCLGFFDNKSIQHKKYKSKICLRLLDQYCCCICFSFEQWDDHILLTIAAKGKHRKIYKADLTNLYIRPNVKGQTQNNKTVIVWDDLPMSFYATMHLKRVQEPGLQ